MTGLTGRGCWMFQGYGVGGHLLKGIPAFHKDASASVRVKGELSGSFGVGVGVRQSCVMSSWLLNVYMDGCMKARVGELGPRLKV